MNKISILLVALIVLSPKPSSAASQDIPQQVAKLVQESGLSKGTCEVFGKSVRDLLKGQTGVPLTDKASAKQLLALVKRYPGIPAAAKEVYEKVGEASFSGELNDDIIRAELGVYECDLSAYFEAMRTLIISAGPLRYSAMEKAEIAHKVLRQISSDLESFGTLAQVYFQEHLLKLLIEEGTLEVSDAIFVETLHLHQQIATTRSQLQNLAKKNPVAVESIATEFKQVKPLSELLSRLANRLLRRSAPIR